MTRIALVAAGILLVGGVAAQFLSSAEKGTVPPAIHPPLFVPVAQETRNPLLDIDPEHARTWLILRVNDGARTVKRLRSQPEMVLLPSGPSEELDALASLREAVLVCDMDSMRPESQRIASYRHQQKMLTMTDAQQPVQATTEPKISSATIAKSANIVVDHPDLPLFSGWIAATSEKSPLLARLRSTLGSPTPPAGIKTTGEGWTLTTTSGDIRINIAGDRVLFATPKNQKPPMISVAPLAPDAEAEFSLVRDPGRKGVALTRLATGSLRIGAEGLRMSMTESLVGNSVKLPDMDRRRFDEVPASAILVGVTAMHPGFNSVVKVGARIFLPNPLGSFPPETQATLKAVSMLLDHVDGTLVAWIEPGVPIPILTVEADLSQVDANEILVVDGLVHAADGSATTMAGPLLISLGWRSGRFVITTNPAGIAGINRSGGFTSHPEIKRALTALPTTNDLHFCALLRSAPALDLVIPLVDVFGHEVRKPLLGYRAALEQNQGYSFFSIRSEGVHTHFDAGGILALAGWPFITQLASDQTALLHVTN